MPNLTGMLTLLLLGGNTSPGLATPEDPEARHLRLCWRDAHGRYPLALDVIQSEVATILAAVDVEVRWVDEVEAAGEAVLSVILMNELPTSWRVPRGAMGVSLKQDRPSNAVFLLLPAIMVNVGLEPSMTRVPTPRERIDLAKAIARVVVHEIVHVLAPELEHRDDAVFRSSMSSYALLHEDIEPDEEVGKALRTGLSRFYGARAR